MHSCILFIYQVSVPTWFTADTRLGCLSIHLDTPQCFSAEMYSADLNISSTSEDSKVIENFRYTFGHSYQNSEY